MQSDPVLIRQVEEISMNAWPALQTMLLDGWVARFAEGYSRRANSVNPLYSVTRDVDELIDSCEQLYRRKGLEVTFKMTAQSLPAGLDARLAQRGYRAEAHTSVQLLDLAGWHAAASGAVVDLSAESTGDWLAGYWRMSDTAAGDQATHRQMLGAMVPQRRFAAITIDGRVVACGLGVLQDGLIGLFDIVTDAGARRQGHAQRLIEALLEWGKSEGAKRGYLQVMVENPPALALYAKLGYREAYRYWYRVKG